MKQTKKNSATVGESGQAMVLPVCNFCNHVPEQGIKGVMRVGKAWICQTCESKIIQMEIGSPDYEIMLEKMRNIWKHPTRVTEMF